MSKEPIYIDESCVTHLLDDCRSKAEKVMLTKQIMRIYGRQVIFTVGDPHKVILDMDKNMSLRDWFAGQVVHYSSNDLDYKRIASNCYKIADAMLTEREKIQS